MHDVVYVGSEMIFELHMKYSDASGENKLVKEKSETAAEAVRSLRDDERYGHLRVKGLVRPLDADVLQYPRRGCCHRVQRLPPGEGGGVGRAQMF